MWAQESAVFPGVGVEGYEVWGQVTRDHIRGHRFKVWQRGLFGGQGTSSFLTVSIPLEGSL